MGIDIVNRRLEGGEEDMGYIMDLRQKVGHAPLIMPSGCVLLLNEKNQLLLQRRTDNGFWSYPGGSMEPGESLEQCAYREVLEETGLKCTELEFFMLESGEKKHYIYPNGDEVYIVEAVYICRKYEGDLQVQKEEALEQRFFDLSDLPDNISPMNQEVINRLKEYIGKETILA